MGRIPTTVTLVRGEGLVARFGNVIILVSGESPSTERILGAAETAAKSGDPGVAIAQRLAATVFSGGSAHPPDFGVIAPTAGGLLVLLRGPIRALVNGPEGTRQWSGERAMTWADEIIRDPIRRLTVAPDGVATTEIPHTDLRSGVVPAGGFIVLAPPRGVSTAPSSTTGVLKQPDLPDAGLPDSTMHVAPPTRSTSPTTGPEPVRRRSSDAGIHSDAAARTADAPGSHPGPPVRREAPESPAHPGGQRRTPSRAAAEDRPQDGVTDKNEAADVLAKRTRATQPGVGSAPETQVIPEVDPVAAAAPDMRKGAKAPQRENDSARPGKRADRPDPADQPPTAAFDASAAAAEEAPPETSAMPAAVGVLGSPEGAVYPLDRPYVLGRDPMIDESVRRAAASPIVIPRDRHVSRVHAYLSVEAGKVLVRDASTPGGTFVAAPGAQDWIRVGQKATELPPGWSLRIGERVFTFRAEPLRR
ncbi:FHA domain-containing protein [Nocardia yamanashiensis]|uniref:FHA domain-containing protein n=1 Tax=Nocardia yamanashiensis TaxID=209247 RepID=UPI001E62C37C|nr:FHA domain-containing protein [Nocardia yamanashiensis]UGT41703.1 FHA domain-containing protein [Nocardia yamanashiensis]